MDTFKSGFELYMEIFFHALTLKSLEKIVAEHIL